MNEYIFRIEKRNPDHPLTPDVLVEFGCTNENQVLQSVVAFAELLKIHKTPEKVAQLIRHNASVHSAKVFVK